jgi:hypothetical protein
MKRGVKVAFCLASGLAMAGVVRAGDTVTPGDPYGTVIERNVFGLNPPPPPNANPQDANNPPPKITPNGTMDILGELQVLFKVVQQPRPGSPPTPDESYILSEGQRQDDIEVVKIDEKNSIVTFNNHGETQTLPLVTTMPASTPAGGAEAPVGKPGGRFSPGFANPGGGPGGHSPHGAVGANFGANYGASGNAGNAPSLGSAPAHNNMYNAASQNPEGMTLEQQVIGMELNREMGRQKGDPVAGLIPPTELTPADATGPTGNPLVPPASGAPE